uniref:tRNA (guanine(26)-N(2))-dimethyltransferase n=1 Tax=Glossina morsitans morsitans TaxID=37546 RepID=A0A1B0FD92_GLOMM
MYLSTSPSKQYDCIDLDPYGCPNRFLDAAIQSFKDGGLLLVTATDYLAFFRLAHVFGFANPPDPTNTIQMILTLKVSDVAFEKASSWKKLKQREQELSGTKTAEKELIEISDYDVELQSVDIFEIFQYSFNYIGVLTGPYYRYCTYRDYFETPFKNYAPCV